MQLIRIRSVNWLQASLTGFVGLATISLAAIFCVVVVPEAFSSRFITSFINLMSMLISLNVIVSHALALLSEPGDPKDLPPEDDGDSTGERFCSTCRIPKPPQVHHCSICNRCVLDMGA